MMRKNNKDQNHKDPFYAFNPSQDYRLMPLIPD